MSATGLDVPATGGQPADLQTDVAPRASRIHRRGDRLIPYWLALPTIVILLGVFAYPLGYMIYLSFHNLTTADLYQHLTPAWDGINQYRAVLTDSQFWVVTERTVIFTLATVAASVILALLIAVLLNRVSGWNKGLISTVLIFVWSVPQIVSISLFSWLTDPNFSVINWLLSRLPFVNLDKHDWYRDPHQGLAVAAAVVIWGAVPFLAITLHAGMTMVPKELLEAARVDGASRWRQFRAVTLPILRPLIVIVTTLSIIWDIQVFTQIWLLRFGAPEPGYRTLSIYTYVMAIGDTRYSAASAIGVLTVLLMFGVMIFYMRQIFRIGDND
jgi:N,N'-diacetylchitobiose transport system permease protein